MNLKHPHPTPKDGSFSESSVHRRPLAFLFCACSMGTRTCKALARGKVVLALAGHVGSWEEKRRRWLINGSSSSESNAQSRVFGQYINGRQMLLCLVPSIEGNQGFGGAALCCGTRVPSPPPAAQKP